VPAKRKACISGADNGDLHIEEARRCRSQKLSAAKLKKKMTAGVRRAQKGSIMKNHSRATKRL
jgi:hypothetical protein